MQYGAMNFPVRPVLDEIELIARLGFDYIEIAMDPPMGHYSVLSSRHTAISHALKENHLDVICHLPTFVSTADLTDSIRRASVTEMRRSLSVAADLEAKKVVLHPSMVFGMGGFTLDVVRGHALDFLSEMAAAAADLGIIICLENMMPRNILGVEPNDMHELLNNFPDFKLTLDTGHATINDMTGRRLMEMVDLLGDRIGHLHFNDNLGTRDDHLAIGEGSIDFPTLLKEIKATGYDETVTLEVFDNDRQKLVESREKIDKMLTNPEI
jgi:sugar phosphate isomerase/epimerase